MASEKGEKETGWDYNGNRELFFKNIAINKTYDVNTKQRVYEYIFADGRRIRRSSSLGLIL